MKHIKSYKIFENIESLIRTHGDIIYKINKDIQFIEDKSLEIKDLGYFVYVNYTPMTLAIAEHPELYKSEYTKSIQFYLDIEKGDNFLNSIEEKNIIELIIYEILDYMSNNGYKIIINSTKPFTMPRDSKEKVKVNPKEVNLNDFQISNNENSYQITFTIDDES